MKPLRLHLRLPDGVLTRRTCLAAGLGLLAWSALHHPARANTEAHVIPAYQPTDAATPPKDSEVAVLAGGCFWGVQAVFQHVKGVSRAVSGYAGGDKVSANYPAVGTGATAHAEAVQVTFDPRQVSFARILQVFFSVAHDPTQLNRQGPDRGTQYRSAIFPTNDEQARVAKAYVAQLDRARVFNAAIVTKIEPDRSFFPAEAYHQDYLFLHPTEPYIVINDLPKLGDLQRIFPDLHRTTPVLVGASGKAR